MNQELKKLSIELEIRSVFRVSLDSRLSWAYGSFFLWEQCCQKLVSWISSSRYSGSWIPSSVLQQCVAVCCSVLQRVAVCCSVLQYVAVCFSVLQCVAVCCSALHRQPFPQMTAAESRARSSASALYDWKAISSLIFNECFDIQWISRYSIFTSVSVTQSALKACLKKVGFQHVH